MNCNIIYRHITLFNTFRPFGLLLSFACRYIRGPC